MKRVVTCELSTGENQLTLPSGAQVIHLEATGIEKVHVWLLVETDRLFAGRSFFVARDFEVVPSGAAGPEHLKTVFDAAETALHVFSLGQVI